MKVDFNESRYVKILVDENKNLIILPFGKYEKIFTHADGTTTDNAYFPACYPIEVKFPYTNVELAEKIELGINEWGKHKCYGGVYEEKVYGVKGFKKAMKGKFSISLGWNFVEGKVLSLLYPDKRGYSYTGMQRKFLAEDADWIDFADAVIELVNLDISTLPEYKRYKSQLNL